MVKVSRGKTATSCPDHSLIQFNCDSLVGDNSKKGEYSFLYPPLWMVRDGRGKTAKNCPDLRGKHSLSLGTSFSPILSAFPDPRSKREN